MSLTGPSRTVRIEPVELPQVEPREEPVPEREPVVPEREPEKVPA